MRGLVALRTLLLWLFASAWLAPLSAQADDAGCLVLAQVSPSALQRVPEPGSEPVARREPPLTESEIRGLLRALEPRKAPQDADARVRGLRDAGLERDRLVIVLRDVTSLLLVLHAADGLDTLAKTSKLDPETRGWMETALGRMASCGRSQIEARGGEKAYQESLALVRKHRRPLEERVLKSMRWDTRSQVAPPPELATDTEGKRLKPAEKRP